MKNSPFSILTLISNFSGAGPEGGGYANTVALQADGKILVGGYWDGWNGNSDPEYLYLVRLNTDGTLDTTFQTNLGDGVDNEVTAIKVQADGKIVIGGYFTNIDGAAAVEIGRLNSDGTPDTTFNTNTGSGLDGNPTDIVQLSDNTLVVGGYFSTYQSVSRGSLIKLNTDGTIDTTFATNVGLGATTTGGVSSRDIYALAIDADDNIIIGGYFEEFDGDSTVKNLFKLSSDGATVVANYGSSLDQGSSIYSIFVDSETRVYAGGYLDYDTNWSGIVRFLNSGTINSGTNPSEDVFIFSGAPLSYENDYTNSLTNLSIVHKGFVDASIDAITVTNGLTKDTNQAIPTFKLGGRLTDVTAIYADSNLKLQASASFMEYKSLIYSFQGFGAAPTTIKYHAGLDKFIVGGHFTTYAGNPATYIAMIGTGLQVYDAYGLGVTYSPFSATFNSSIYDIAIQDDDKIIVVGAFTTVNGESKNRIVRLNTDGTNDNTFDVGTGFNNYAKSVGILSDGKVAVTGAFTSYDGTSVGRFIILDTDGTANATFLSNTGTGFTTVSGSFPQWKLIVQPDDKVLVTGQNTRYNGAFAAKLFRINPDGTHDGGFTPALGFDSHTIALQTDGKILFHQASGGRFGRLNSNGTADTAFNTNVGSGLAGGTQLRTIHVQDNGKIILAGSFTSYKGNPANNFVRVNSDGTIDTTFNIPPIPTNDANFQTTSLTGFAQSAILELGSYLYVVGFETFIGANVGYFTRLTAETGLAHTSNNVYANGLLNYLSDYSPLYTDRSFVDKAYVDNAIAGTNGVGSISASNGLTKTGNDILLGGELTENTTIDGVSNTWDMTFDNINAFSVTSSNGYYVTSNGGGIYLTETTSGGIYLESVGGGINITDTGAGGMTLSTDGGFTVLDESGSLFIQSEAAGSTELELRANRTTGGPGRIIIGTENNGAGVYRLDLNATNALFTDSTGSPAGLQYSNDYSATFTNRSLVDKEYVDGAITSSNVTLLDGNGTTAVNGTAGTSINLGGTLIENTTIDADGNSLTLSNLTNISLTSTNGVYTSSVSNFYSSFSIDAYDDNDVSQAIYIDTENSAIDIQSAKGANNLSLSFDSFNNAITLYSTGAGIEYGDDYSNNFTDRSLVDKEYVVSAIYQASTSGTATKYKTIITGDDVETDFIINHNLATRDVIVQVYANASPYDTVETYVERTDINNVLVSFNTAPVNGVEYKILVQSI